jgi:signal peptidase I
MTDKTQTRKTVFLKATLLDCIKGTIYLLAFFAFLYWVGSWWGLLVVPFLFDLYFTKFIKWGWWKELKNPLCRYIMSWVDAIIFAGIAIYFLNVFFFQNFVIPTSSLEKTLLVGDYLCVSKVSYGPCIPRTPLTMPLTQNTMPAFLGGGKSYLENPQWEYRRIKGLGEVQLNDIVVFNFPAGDTVCIRATNPDYRTACYSIGQQIIQESNAEITPTESMTYEHQQLIYERQYALGRQYILNNPQIFGEIVVRATDRKDNYVKRCVGLPGQTLRIVNGIIHLDGAPQPQPEHAQFNYDVTFRREMHDETLKKLGISFEDIQSYMAGHGLPLTQNTKAELERLGFIDKNAPLSESASGGLYPINMSKDWTAANYGGPNGIWIPKKGVKRTLTLEELPIYAPCITTFEGNTLEVKNNQIFINGTPTTEYTFKQDYYWMMGDNRDCSADSRFWGFVPEDHIVGKPIFIWLSLDPDRGIFNGGIRWKRLFKTEF